MPSAWDADYWFNQWSICAEEFLLPLVELAYQIGNEPLRELLRVGVDRAKDEAKRYERESERLYSEL